jgi:hypothetical protein
MFHIQIIRDGVLNIDISISPSKKHKALIELQRIFTHLLLGNELAFDMGDDLAGECAEVTVGTPL